MIENFKTEMIERFSATQVDVMATTAGAIIAKIESGGNFFVVGTGPSHMSGEEFYACAGGLAHTKLIAPMTL